MPRRSSRGLPKFLNPTLDNPLVWIMLAFVAYVLFRAMMAAFARGAPLDIALAILVALTLFHLFVNAILWFTICKTFFVLLVSAVRKLWRKIAQSPARDGDA